MNCSQIFTNHEGMKKEVTRSHKKTCAALTQWFSPMIFTRTRVLLRMWHRLLSRSTASRTRSVNSTAQRARITHANIFSRVAHAASFCVLSQTVISTSACRVAHFA